MPNNKHQKRQNEKLLKIPLKLIFLDIDGVLLPFNSSEDTFSKTALNVLNEIVKQTNAEIVLSSTWRMDETAVDIIYNQFKCHSSLKNIKFKRWNRTSPNMHSLRASEIQHFIEHKANKLGLHIESYVVLDDEPVVIPNKKPFDSYFVNKSILTDSYVGLTKDHLNMALDILNGNVGKQRNRITSKEEEQEIDNNNISISNTEIKKILKKNNNATKETKDNNIETTRYKTNNELLKNLHRERMKRKIPNETTINLTRFYDKKTLEIRIMEKPGKQIGTIIWPGSILLAEFIFSNQHLFINNSNRSNICGNKAIELGAGCGLVGITFAKLNLGTIDLTEQNKDGIFEILNASINLNFIENGNNRARATNVDDDGINTMRKKKNNNNNNTSINNNEIINVKEYKWDGKNNDDSIQNDTYSIVLAADCLYSKTCVVPLYECIAEKLITKENKKNTKFILSYRPRDFIDEIDFFQLMLNDRFIIYKIKTNPIIADKRLEKLVEITNVEQLKEAFENNSMTTDSSSDIDHHDIKIKHHDVLFLFSRSQVLDWN